MQSNECELSKRAARQIAKGLNGDDTHTEGGLFKFIVVPGVVGLSQLPKKKESKR